MENIKLCIARRGMLSLDIEELYNIGVGIECQSFPQEILDSDYKSIIKSIKENKKLYESIISLHGASFDLNPGSTDKMIRDVTKYRYIQSIEIAKELNCKYVIFHSQINPLISVDKVREKKLDNQILFLKEIIENIIDSDMTILIENEYDSDYKELLDLIEGVNSSKLKICLDIGHVLAYSNKELSLWIHNLKEHIAYIHLHFNDGSIDSHSKPTDEELVLLRSILEKESVNPIISLEYNVEDFTKEIKRILQTLK